MSKQITNREKQVLYVVFYSKAETAKKYKQDVAAGVVGVFSSAVVANAVRAVAGGAAVEAVEVDTIWRGTRRLFEQVQPGWDFSALEDRQQQSSSVDHGAWRQIVRPVPASLTAPQLFAVVSPEEVTGLFTDSSVADKIRLSAGCDSRVISVQPDHLASGWKNSLEVLYGWDCSAMPD